MTGSDEPYYKPGVVSTANWTWAYEMAFANIYTHRKVAEGAARGCEICFKPSTSVLITPDKEDFFYICAKHLKERTFCTPVIDKAQVEAKKKKEEEDRKERALKEEMELVKKEYEEKQKKKEGKDDDKSKEKSKDEGGKRDNEQSEKTEGSKKDDNNASKTTEESSKPEDEPRVFSLQKFVYQQRLEKKRQADVAKRNRERLSNPSFFPSVPKTAP